MLRNEDMAEGDGAVARDSKIGESVHDGGCDSEHNAKITSLLELATNNSPPALARLLLQFAPVIRVIMMILSVVAPIYLKAFPLLHAIIKVRPWDLVQALVGLGLCFFGGKYCAAIAAAEAFYLTGWARTRGETQSVERAVTPAVSADRGGSGPASARHRWRSGARSLWSRQPAPAGFALPPP